MPRPDLLIVARGGGSLEDLVELQRRGGGARRRRQLNPADRRRRPRDRLDADRSRGRHARADADRGGRIRACRCAPNSSQPLADLDARRRGAILRFARRLRADLRAMSRALPGGEAIVAEPRQRLDRAAETLIARVRAGVDQRALGAVARAAPRPPFAARRSRWPAGAGARPHRTLGPARVTLVERPAGRGRGRTRVRARGGARTRGARRARRKRSRGFRPAWLAHMANACRIAALSFSPLGNCSAR